MSVLVHCRPNDVRGFLHKRIFGAIKGTIGGIIRGGPLGGITGGLGGFLGGGREDRLPSGVPQRNPCPPGFIVGRDGRCFAPPINVSGRPGTTMFAGGDPDAPAWCPGCVWRGGRWQRPVPGLKGILQRVVPGGATGFATPFDPRAFAVEPVDLVSGRGGGVDLQRVDVGDAVKGQYGAGFEPMVVGGERRLCARGAVLGKDGICYNKRDLRNSERAWPKGRQPLLTGGEMRCIQRASSAAKRVTRTVKRLQGMGMMKKPGRARQQLQIGPGHHTHVAHD